MIAELEWNCSADTCEKIKMSQSEVDKLSQHLSLLRFIFIYFSGHFTKKIVFV